jgi:glutamate-ammonia-ligase adenylyltransferase
VVTYSDNIRQLDALSRHGVMDESQAQQLTDAYRAYRALAHQQALAMGKQGTSPESLAQWRRVVEAAWQQVFA